MEFRRPTVTTKTVPHAESGAVASGKARVVAVLDRATQSLRALEARARAYGDRGEAVPGDLAEAIASAELHEERAWKLMSMIDRMLFATSPRGGKGNKSCSEVLRARSRWLEQRELAALQRAVDVDRRRRGRVGRGRPRDARVTRDEREHAAEARSDAARTRDAAARSTPRAARAPHVSKPLK